MTPEADSVHIKLLSLSLDAAGAKTVGDAARIIREQAAEIERLRAALKDIADFSEPFLASTAYVMRDKARAAFEQSTP